jgi:hypothetical protein
MGSMFRIEDVHLGSPKSQNVSTRLHGVTFQKTAITAGSPLLEGLCTNILTCAVKDLVGNLEYGADFVRLASFDKNNAFISTYLIIMS